MADDDELAASIDAAILAADRGEFISNEAMCAWLSSWGTENELPPPEVDIRKAPRSRRDQKPQG
ncbi:hypothetical protein [Rhizobium sp. S163]|uniref:hypothetical protein n=1 Tax=Rhizobium sp. S163 TaxID=3055039 RepID=UPI0025A96593|nr:hypothetical protein [Rhizobium sp. S163]MDM9648935.1 hypothetical protein [Rhizobium sp. S163]